GRYIAYASRASNLVAGDTNAAFDIFRYDMETGDVARASVSTQGAEANLFSDFPSISSDGRFIAFNSVASNLIVGDSNNETDVFLHDMITGSTTRVSVSTAGTQGTGTSQKPSVSGDGRYVAFESSAPNLV